MNITTNLFGKTNAILTDHDNGDVIAIISCGKKEDITSKIEKAIADHFTATDVNITMFNGSGNDVLTNQNQIYFTTEHLEDGEESCRDFKIKVYATY